MENLHRDITLEILSRLPAESVIQCKLVCKAWRALLRLPCFADIHLSRQLQLDGKDNDGGGGGAKADWRGFFFELEEFNKVQLCYGGQHIFDNNHQYYNKRLTRLNHHIIKRQPETTNIVGSCNGLICLTVTHHGIDDPVYIFNPITGEYVFLERFTNTIWNVSYIISGFSYHPSTNEYKVVRIPYYCYEDGGPLVGKVQVYTLGSGNGWRDKGETPYTLRNPWPGILANGALHWLDEEGKIVAFDLAEEEFHLLPSPPCVDPSHGSYELQELGRCLCVVHQIQQPQKNLDIWTLKWMKEQDYKSWSWTKDFSIASEGLDVDNYWPVTLTKKSEILLQCNFEVLCLYDQKTRIITKVPVDTDGKYSKAIPHVNSFVSLKALGEKSWRRRGRSKDGQISWTSTRAKRLRYGARKTAN